MGLLKLGSLYKKKSKKDALPPPVPAPVAPKLEPISLELNLDLNNSSSIQDTNTIATTTLPQQQRNINNTPAGSGSLFDDIFSELTTTTAKPVAQQDAMQNDISLAVALSQQLQLEENKSTNGMTGTTQKGSNTVSSTSHSNKNEAPSSNVANFLLGGDSIYSSYLRNISALDHDPPSTDSTFSTSMFDNLLGNSKPSTTSNTPASAAAAAAATNNNNNNNNSLTVPTATKVVLDSDISDSDEDSKNDSEDDNTSQLLNYDGNQRMTRGVRPIMERRTQDNRLLVQRKIDNWANRVDPEANQVESNESMISRMRDRHRSQVKLAALRQQQQDQQQQLPQYTMMPHHMVAQPYGPAAAIPLSPNVVLPHPGMLMDPAQMYYSTPINDYPETPVSHTQPTPPPPPPPVPLPSGFLPNPSHATLAIPHKDKEDKHAAAAAAAAAAAERPFPSQSYSTPTHASSGRPKPSRSPPAMPVAPSAEEMTPFSVGSSASGSNVNVNVQTQDASPATSSVTLQSSLPTDVDDDKSAIAESPVKEEQAQPRAMEDETMGAEADAESSDDEERKSVILRKKKSMKKLRQKQQQQGSVDDSSDTNQRQIRSSRSAPNLKKKQSSKKMSKSTSRSSSRRNSQETCTPPSELISTPPPLPSNYEEEYHLSRSHSHQQMHQTSSPPAPPLPQTQHHQHYYQHPQQQNRQYQRQSLRHMKSEPELPRRSQYLPAQQQQLNSEWERMQVHQREQQLKKQYLQGGHSNSLPAISTSHAQQPMPYMPMYSSPVYYPSMPPSMMPYAGSSGMDTYNTPPHVQQDAAHRASMMSSYYQQQPPQGYYHPSHR